MTLNRFPAASNHASGNVGGIPTAASFMGFSDRLLVTVSQDGRLMQWVRLSRLSPRVLIPICSRKHSLVLPPLPALPCPFPSVGVASPRSRKIEVKLSGSPVDAMSFSGEGLQPLIRLAPQTLLGHGDSDRETTAHLVAAHVGSQVVARRPLEGRTLLVGLGLREARLSREAFMDLVELLDRAMLHVVSSETIR